MRFMQRQNYLFAILLSLCYGIIHPIFAATIQTQLSHHTITIEESLTLTYKSNDSTATTPDFTPLEKDFTILSTNYGSTIKILNGQTQIQKFWQLQLEPKRVGELILPEINFGKEKSSIQKLIVRPSVPTPTNNVNNLNYFIQAELDNQTPYVRSQIHYTLKLFYQTPLENVKIELPQIKDMEVMQLGQDKYYRTVFHGKAYSTYEKHLILSPQKTGQFYIPSTILRAITYESTQNSFNDLFAIAAPKNIKLKTQSFSITVQAIPSSFLTKTWLPAKNISLTEKWSNDKNQWQEGNPVTRTITMRAEGLRADQLPDFKIDHIAGINVYTDLPRRYYQIQNHSVIGILQQKITYLPTSIASFTLPAIALPWWNTRTNTQVITRLPSLPIRVIPSLKQRIPPVKQSPVPINTNQSTLPYKSNAPVPFYFSIWFWLSFLLLLGWMITLIYIWKKSTPKRARVIKQKSHRSDHTELIETDFIKACKDDNAFIAQQFLLAWGLKSYPHQPPYNLAQLRNKIENPDFKKALKDLEIALYAKKMTAWEGQDLLAAYQQNLKYMNLHSKESSNLKDKNQDPLPPLHP